MKTFLRKRGLKLTERGEYVLTLTGAVAFVLGLYLVYVLLAHLLGVADVPDYPVG